MTERCVVCGRRPTNVCCVRCHTAHDVFHRPPLVDVSKVRAAKAATGTVVQFAKRLGVAPSTVDGWLYMGVSPNAEAARIIQEIIDVPLPGPTLAG